MKYSKDDIYFEGISPSLFENLFYDLLVKYNFQQLVWREGAADNGRDIEATYTFNNTIRPKETKWFFECKHYNSGGVPAEHLHSKIAWADAELPDFLVIVTSTHLTNNARTWLEKISCQKPYDIICIEGEELKDRLINYPDLIERYFSQNRYEQMLMEIKGYKIKFRINPSYEILREIIGNIDLTKLDMEDIGFLLFNFYNQYEYFESRKKHYLDFDDKTIYPLLAFLKNTITEETAAILPNTNTYEIIETDGIFDHAFYLKSMQGIGELKLPNYHICNIRLNYKQENWKDASYLFIMYENVGFEIFKSDEIHIRIIKDFTFEKLDLLSLNVDALCMKKYVRSVNNFLKKYQVEPGNAQIK